MERNEVTKRFLETVDSIYSQDKDFLIESEIKKSTFSQVRSGRQQASLDMILALSSVRDEVNTDYILTGRGTPLRTPEVTQIFHPKGTEKTEEEGVITLYDVEAAANLKSLFDNKDQNILGQINIPNIPKCDGAVYVKGDSMYPLLKSGDIVAYKEVPLEMSHIFFGEMYLVSIDLDGDEYLTVKYVQHSEKGEDWIKLVSYNQNHQPKDFPLSSVRAMALVKLSIRMNTMK
mgnify:CR=1 FL=1|jgi:hypothetical protein